MISKNLFQPILIYLYGMPGSGKSLLAKNLSEDLGIAHINSDKIRSSLFMNKTPQNNQNKIIINLMDMMAEEYMKLGVSVIYDISANRAINRKSLREFAKKFNYKEILIWVQIDEETAKFRSQHRDKRKLEDRYSYNLDDSSFKNEIDRMQSPLNEEPVVVSGKHHYNSQKNPILKRLLQLGVVSPEDLGKKIAKPELVNLVSKAQVNVGRVNLSRRNILIR